MGSGRDTATAGGLGGRTCPCDGHGLRRGAPAHCRASLIPKPRVRAGMGVYKDIDAAWPPGEEIWLIHFDAKLAYL